MKSFIKVLLCSFLSIQSASACIDNGGCWSELRTNALLIVGTTYKIDSPALIRFYAGYGDLIIALLCLAAVLLICFGTFIWNRFHNQTTAIKSLPYAVIIPICCMMFLALIFHSVFVPLNELLEHCDITDCI